MVLTKFKDGDCDVVLERFGREYVVTYGLQVTTFKGRDADLKACVEYGRCIRHSLECAGKIPT